MFDDTPGGAWTGDIGAECGQDWYEQNEKAGYLDKDQKEAYIPRCKWLDEDHSNDIKSAAMKFSTTAYGNKVTETVEKSHACDATKWGKDSGPINGINPI